ncbi:RHS repeat-associated core domain-containing protein, partial [Flavobacterium lindanitolerans]|uniref:RHS repeat domain-containing protein n=1 Tax=Flavobacterium lindanitolerans TaxID=428988 RepID=UPI0031E08C35
LAASPLNPVPQFPYNYKYNGKEFQNEMGMDLYDYGARNYDPAIGRWMNIDNHADSYFSSSPYSSFANNPISFVDPTGEDVLFWQWFPDENLPYGGKWEHVSFNKLDKKIKQGILDFLETEAGQQFFALFAKKGDRIGNFLFTKNGIYSKHTLSILESNHEMGAEGTTEYEGWNIGINFKIFLNKDMENPIYNIPETLGHELFLHLNNDMRDYIKAFNENGWRGSDAVDAKDKEVNPKGYLDHLGMTNDKKGRAKKYYEFISQLKQILNPEEVQKQVEKDRVKNFKHGTEVSNNIKNKKKP